MKLFNLSFPKLFTLFVATASFAPSALALNRPRSRLAGKTKKSSILPSSVKDRPTIDHALRRKLLRTMSPLAHTRLRGHSNDERGLQTHAWESCSRKIDELYANNSAVALAVNKVSAALDPLYGECTENPCIVDEDEDIDQSLVEAYRDACLATNGGTLYEYNLYLDCANDTGGVIQDHSLNFDYCLPSARFCRPEDVDYYVNSLLVDSAAKTEANLADKNYVCDGLDVDFLGSENSGQATCNDNTGALFDANPDLVAARDLLGDSFSQAYYDDSTCTDATVNCVVNEDELDGAQEYFDTCIAAGGRIWEFDLYFQCVNNVAGLVKNQTILGYDLCFASQTCPIQITRPLANQDVRYYAEEMAEMLGADWTCNTRTADYSAFFPIPPIPPTPTPPPPPPTPGLPPPPPTPGLPSGAQGTSSPTPASAASPSTMSPWTTTLWLSMGMAIVAIVGM